MIYIILIFLFLNGMFLNIYCGLQEWNDKRRMKKSFSSEGIYCEDKEKDSRIKIIYRWLNSYLYGYTRTMIIMTGKIPSHRIRKMLYKYVFRMKISAKTIIYGGTEIRSPWNIKMGICTVAANCILDGRSGIEIGDNVVLGANVHIWTEEHDVNDPFFRVLPSNRQPVIINDYAWVCSDTTLLPGVIIGKGAVVAARACVTKNCEDFGIYAGVPAKKINNRNQKLKYKLNGRPTWHFS